MKKNSFPIGILLIIVSYLPVLFRFTYHYDTWYLYALKIIVDTAFVSFAWLIVSGFRQGFIRRILSQSLHGKFHNYLGYSAIAGVLVHPLAYIWLWSDWRILIPFLHSYGLLVSLGSIGVGLLLLTGFSSYFIRKRYYDLWNVLHYLNYAFFFIIFIHVWQSLPVTSPTAIYYIVIFLITVSCMIYKWMFDLRLLSFHTTVLSITPVAKDTYNVRFKVPFHIDTWDAGEYVMITIDRMDDHHPFSVSKINDDETVEITFKVFGNFTKKFSQVQAGQKLFFAGPYGTANKMVQYRQGQNLVLLAGGIGITPFRCITHRLLEQHDTRNIYLFYCVSSVDYFAFDVELTALAQRYPNFKYIKICSQPTSDTTVIQGYISDTILKRYVGDDLTKHSYMVCGPDPMLAAVNVLLRNNKVPRYQIHREEFSY